MTFPFSLQFNVQSTQPLPQDVYGAAGGGGAGAGGGGSGGSVSSGGGASPAASPPRPHHRLRAKEEDLSLHGRTSAEGIQAHRKSTLIICNFEMCAHSIVLWLK